MASDDDMAPELGGAAEVFGVETPRGELIRHFNEDEEDERERREWADKAREEAARSPLPRPPPPVTANEFKQGLAEDFLGEPKAASPAPATPPPRPDPPKGCLSRLFEPKVLAIEAVAVILAAVFIGFAAELGPFEDDGGKEEISTDATSSDECRDEGALGGEGVLLISVAQACTDETTGALSTTTTEEATATTPAIDPLGPVSLTGQFDEIDGQPVEGVFRNEVVLQLGPDGLTGTMDLVVDSTFNFDTEEPVCFSFAVDFSDAPIAAELAEDGSRQVLGPTTIVVGFTDGACTGGPPGETESRAGEVAMTVPQDAESVSGQLVLEGTPLTFTVTP